MASSALATAFVNIVPGTVAVENYLKTQLGGQVATAGDAAGAGMAKGVAAGFGSKIKGYLAPVLGTMAATFAAVQIKDFLKESITAASDFNEQGTAVGQVFGNAAKDIQAFAASGAKSLGQSKVQILDAAKSFGIYGQAAGLAGSDNADFSKTMVGLATDLASFNNTSVDEAIQALGSGLRGEAEPLRRFGVLLDDATLRSKAMEMGLTKTTKQALTPQMKVLAAYGSIMEQTGTQQGDFERTSSGLANQQRILAAQTENMKIALGTKLLPVMTSLASFANTTLIPAFSALGQFFSDYAAPIGAFAGTVALLTLAINAQAIATGIATSAAWAWTAALLANPTTWIVLGVAALIAGIVLLATKTTFFQDAWKAMTKFAVDAWNSVVAGVQAFGTWISQNWKTILSWILFPMLNVIQLIINNWGTITKFFSNLWGNVLNFFKTVWNNMVAGAMSAVNGVVSFFATLPGKVMSFLAQLPGKITGLFASAGTWLISAGRNVVEGLIKGASQLLPSVGKFFLDLLPSWIREPFKKALGIASPSKVFIAFGKNIGQGLTKGLSGSESQVRDQMTKVANWVTNQFNDKKLTKKTATAANKLIAAYTTSIAGAAAKHDVILQQLDDAQQNLADKMKERADFVDSIGRKYGSSLNIEANTTASNIIQSLKDRIDKNKRLAEVMGRLKELGLSGDLYQQILDSGNLELANSIISAGSSAVAELNALAAEANTTALKLGEDAANILYGKGIQAAQGVVDGLKAKESELAAFMASLGAQFAAAIGGVIAADTAQAEADAAAAAKKKTTTTKKTTTPAKKVTSKTAGAAVKKATPVKKKLALGGLVNRPTRALIGENGPELVTPLRDFERLVQEARGGQTVIYNAAPNQSLDAEQALFQAIKRAKVVGAW